MLKAVGLNKTYGSGHTSLTVIDNLNFEYQKGEVVGVYGSSGSGKSTFLHMIGGLDFPTSGDVFFGERNLYQLSERELAAYRNRTIGFVFQFYHLLPEFSAEENVMIPCLIGGEGRAKAKELAAHALERVSLADRRSQRPSELSGGEQQRVAIARAIVMNPQLLLADEPTGNLDKKTGSEIMDVLMDLNQNGDMGIIMVTHDPSLVTQMDRELELKDGSFSA